LRQLGAVNQDNPHRYSGNIFTGIATERCGREEGAASSAAPDVAIGLLPHVEAAADEPVASRLGPNREVITVAVSQRVGPRLSVEVGDEQTRHINKIVVYGRASQWEPPASPTPSVSPVTAVALRDVGQAVDVEIRKHQGAEVSGQWIVELLPRPAAARRVRPVAPSQAEDVRGAVTIEIPQPDVAVQGLLQDVPTLARAPGDVPVRAIGAITSVRPSPLKSPKRYEESGKLPMAANGLQGNRPPDG
jgi:hypothetical protein